MTKPAFALMAKAWLAPLVTVTAPEGVMLPLAPAEAVTSKFPAGALAR
jgi:hypothetical protein